MSRAEKKISSTEKDRRKGVSATLMSESMRTAMEVMFESKFLRDAQCAVTQLLHTSSFISAEPVSQERYRFVHSNAIWN